MKITDAAVFPYPCGDSSVRRMALEAETLGLDSLVAVDVPSGICEGIEIRSGVLLRDLPVKDVIARVRKNQDTGAVMIVNARDNGFNRAVLSLKGVHILRGIHAAEKTAFDHVTAKMAADCGVALDIDLSPLIFGRGIARQRAIHRYRDMLLFERRFEFPLTLSTGARSVLDMRATREITALCSLLGMDIPDVEKAFGGVGQVTSPPVPSVRVIP
jgi:ribonuclease P/MRP protein subunit RPP1